MRIREYSPGDLDALRRLHAAQGFGYPLPNLESPLFVVKLVLEDDEPQEEKEENDALGHGSARPLAGEVGRWRRPACQQACATQGREEATLETSDAGLEASNTGHGSRGAKHEPRILAAVLLRLTAETYLLHDPHAGTPRLRWQRFLALHEAARQASLARGLDDVQAFLPPRIARAFGRRLARLGWRQDPWPCFTRVTSG
jgi:hypothetical protein